MRYHQVIETLTKFLAIARCFPLIKTYFMDVFNMTYVKNTTVHKLKKQQKLPCNEEKSDSRRKVVIVRRTLI